MLIIVVIVCTVCICNKIDESNSELWAIDYRMNDLPNYMQASDIYNQLDYIQSDLDAIFTDVNNIRQDVDDIWYKLWI